MGRISIYNKKTGELFCRAIDHEDHFEIFENDVLAKALEPFKNQGSIVSFLDRYSDKLLIKSDGIELKKEETTDQPNVLDPNTPADLPVFTEDITKRIEPALTLLREILKRAEAKRQERSELKAHNQALDLERQNAQVVLENDGQYYVTMDGDGIGNQVARAQYTDDERKVKEISARIDQGKNSFVQWATSFGGVVVEVGGDEGQVRVSAPALERIEEFRQTYLKQVGATVTVGVGKTISQSVQARELGKLRGKNQVVYWDENTEKELNLRLQQKGDESPEQKLIDSGVVAPIKETPKMGVAPEAPARAPSKYSVPKGEFDENTKKQEDYETWLKSQSSTSSS